MKTATLLLITFVLCSCSNQTTVMPDESSLRSQWAKRDLSTKERDKLVELSEKEPFETIIPILLPLLVDCQPNYGINYEGSKPWNMDRLSSEDRTYVMADSVWIYQMKPRDDFSKANVLLALLRKTSRREEKGILISALQHEQWTPDAEKDLADIANNTNEPCEFRQEAVEALLYHCEVNLYVPIAIEIIRAHDEKGQLRCASFSSICEAVYQQITTPQGYRPSTLNETNKYALISEGFEILTELPKENLQIGAGAAFRLGNMLGIKDEFNPDRSAKKYQDRGPFQGALREEFFADTVKNALAWYSTNGNNLLKSAETLNRN